MATNPNRLTVALDEDSIQLLRKIEALTGLSPGATVAKLFPSHLEELWSYVAWLESLPDSDHALRHQGLHLLQSYGPLTLIDDIKRLDPTFKTPGERFAESANGTKS